MSDYASLLTTVYLAGLAVGLLAHLTRNGRR